MAAAAVPFIEAALGRLLIALGLTATTSATVDQVRKRKEEADNARTAPIAKTDAQTKAKEKCKECPPDKGSLVPVNHSMPPVSAAYQARITGFPPGSEWSYLGVDFDGFRSSQCLLQEAKAQYDQFFDEYHLPKEWWARSEKGEKGMIKQARNQYSRAVPRPPVRLCWYFMEPTSYFHFTSVFAVQFPGLETVHEP